MKYVQKGTQTRLLFVSLPKETKATRILEIVSSDVCGPVYPATFNDERYFVTFIDHSSHFELYKKSDLIK